MQDLMKEAMESITEDNSPTVLHTNTTLRSSKMLCRMYIKLSKLKLCRTTYTAAEWR